MDADPATDFALDTSSAELYEAEFVPAIFAGWAPRLLDLIDLGPDDHLLDVACGTGIVARAAAARLGPAGSVTGVDANDAMLAVARRVAPQLDWRSGDAHALGFADRSFDAVTCQMALMFFTDRAGALAEMRRVVRPSGTVGVLVPASLDEQPAYQRFVEVAADCAGPRVRPLLGAYWACGDLDRLTDVVEGAGLAVGAHRTETGPSAFASVADFVRIEVGGTPLARELDGATTSAILEGCASQMAEWQTPGGFTIPLVCHLLTAHPR